MKCTRCGRNNAAASWYCAHCGRPLSDTNVAPESRGQRWTLPVAALALVAVVAVALAAAIAGNNSSAGTPGEAVPPLPTPPTRPLVVAGAPSLEAGSPGAQAAATPRIVTSAAPENSPISATASAAGAAHVAWGEPVWRIPHLPQPPQIDGLLDEWPAPPVSIRSIVFGDAHWSGPADLSADAVAGWDDLKLYLGVRVTDDVVSQPSRGERLYLGDSVELQLDADRQGDANLGHYNDDDFQIGLSPGNFGHQPPEAYIWRPDIGRPSGVALAARQLNDGYVLEAAIPWRLLGVNPQRTPSLGIALNVSDNDLPAPAQLTMVSTTPNRSWADPRSFGTLVLTPPGERPAAPAFQQGPPP